MNTINSTPINNMPTNADFVCLQLSLFLLNKIASITKVMAAAKKKMAIFIKSGDLPKRKIWFHTITTQKFILDFMQ